MDNVTPSVLDHPSLAERAASATNWPEPTPLPGGLPPVDELDPDIVPTPLCGWLSDIAERMQVTLDYVASTAMVVLGALVGRAIGIHPKQRDDWLVVPNLWGAVVGRPAMMKSPAIAEVVKPLNRLVAEADKAHETAIKEYEADCEIAEAKQKARKAAMDRAAKKDADDTELRRLSREIVTQPKKPTPRRYKTNDGTIEAVGQILLDNPNGVLVLRDELTGLLRSLDKEGHETDRAFYLEGWNGTNGSYTVDRIGRGTLAIPALTLSVFGGIQPGPLQDYIHQATQGGGGDDGLLQRFQLLVWPDAPTDWRNVDRWPDTDAKNRAYGIFVALSNLNPVALGATACDADAIPALRFSPKAQDIFNEWREDLERRLRDGSIQSPPMEAHLAKYRSLFPSLALLIHLINVADGAPVGPVSEDAALRAAAWCSYLESHANRLYAAIENPAMESARRLLEKLIDGAVKLEDGAFKPRDVYRHHWTRLSTPSDVADAISILEDYGWVAGAKAETGGRPSQQVRVHPRLMECSHGE